MGIEDKEDRRVMMGTGVDVARGQGPTAIVLTLDVAPNGRPLLGSICRRAVAIRG